MSVSENEGKKKQPGQNYLYFCSSFSFCYWKTTFADGFQIYRKVFKSIVTLIGHLNTSSFRRICFNKSHLQAFRTLGKLIKSPSLFYSNYSIITQIFIHQGILEKSTELVQKMKLALASNHDKLSESGINVQNKDRFSEGT